MTLFIELAAPDAEEVLTAFAESLTAHPACSSWRLLSSAEQESLFLLVVDWRAELPPELPGDAKLWKFKLLRTNEHEF